MWKAILAIKFALFAPGLGLLAALSALLATAAEARMAATGSVLVRISFPYETPGGYLRCLG